MNGSDEMGLCDRMVHGRLLSVLTRFGTLSRWGFTLKEFSEETNDRFHIEGVNFAR